MAKLKTWLESRQGLHPPKSKLGIAIRYALRQWADLTVFLDDPTVPPDNNRSGRRSVFDLVRPTGPGFLSTDTDGQELGPCANLVT